MSVLRRALTDTVKGLGNLGIEGSDEMLGTIARLADRDARVGLNLLEQVAMVVPAGGKLTQDAIEKVAGHKVYTYDKKGDAHYDTVSAFIKSMRGSDPDAALHYLARMIEAGEQPSFIARRLVICAAEDVGLADPQPWSSPMQRLKPFNLSAGLKDGSSCRKPSSMWPVHPRATVPTLPSMRLSVMYVVKTAATFRIICGTVITAVPLNWAMA